MHPFFWKNYKIQSQIDSTENYSTENLDNLINLALEAIKTDHRNGGGFLAHITYSIKAQSIVILI
jgi:hypothetical protein